jgi:hypothetical protein
MTRSDATAFLNTWEDMGRKVFAYHQALLPTEYLVIIKTDGKYETINGSTARLPIMDHTDMLIKLSTGALTFKHASYSGDDQLHMKTGSCTCGAWATRDPDCHAHYCDKKDYRILRGNYGGYYDD